MNVADMMIEAASAVVMDILSELRPPMMDRFWVLVGID
jgi:hypothetical protein